MTLKLFFRRIEVEGLTHVPRKGPVLLVANHSNSLIDPLLPLTALNRTVTLTAKNVLSNNPLLALLFWGLDAVQFHRAEDVEKGANPRENVKSMQRCREILSDGGMVCIFPEGISHSDLQMRQFHNGAAKIALDFVRKDGNPGQLTIIPVGLLYTGKDQFRSDVWLRFGEAIDAEKWLEAHTAATVDTLTEELRISIERLTLNYEDRREMLLVNWASQLAATGGASPATLGAAAPSVSESFLRISRVQSGYRALQDTHRADVDSLSARMRAYRLALRRHGISAAEVFMEINPVRALLFAARELELLVVGFPLALFGIVTHFVPFACARVLAIKLSKDKDHWATNVVYPMFVILPLAYAALLTAVWFLFPCLWAFIFTLLLPYSLWYALLYTDRVSSASRRTRAFFHFVKDRPTHDALMREGREILTDLFKLAAQLPRSEPFKDQP